MEVGQQLTLLSYFRNLHFALGLIQEIAQGKSNSVWAASRVGLDVDVDEEVRGFSRNDKIGRIKTC